MAENKKAEFHAKLIGADGFEISCTTKTPKLKLVREVRTMSRRLEKIREVFSELSEIEERNSNRIAVLKGLLRDPKVQKADELQAELDALNKSQESIAAEKDANDAAVYAALIDQADAVLNYTNKEGVTEDPVRTKADIDWENTDLREIRGAIDFFSDAARASSNDTKS